MSSKPVSVATACRNEEEVLPWYFSSLYAIRDIIEEIIIVDGGSTDRTHEIIQAAAKVLPVQLIVRDDFQYVTQQKNLAISLCKAPFVMALDSDETIDSLLPQKLSSLTGNGLAWHFMKWYTIRDRFHHARNSPGGPCHKIFKNGHGIRYNRKIHDHFCIPNKEYDGGALQGNQIHPSNALHIHLFDNRLRCSDEGLLKKWNQWKERGILQHSAEEGIALPENFWLLGKQGSFNVPGAEIPFDPQIRGCILWSEEEYPW